jgi:hypothetical protein
MPVIYSRGGPSTPIYVVAYDTAGGPRRLVAGREITEKDEIIVDASLARKYGFAPGDSVEFMGHGFTIAARTSSTRTSLPSSRTSSISISQATCRRRSRRMRR